MVEAQIERHGNKFENFLTTAQGEDLFDKAKKVAQILNSGILTGNEGLGMRALDKVSGEYFIREKDGKSHSVIMFGSNSYLRIRSITAILRGFAELINLDIWLPIFLKIFTGSKCSLFFRT